SRGNCQGRCVPRVRRRELRQRNRALRRRRQSTGLKGDWHMNAPDLLRAYLAKVREPASAAALFADDGVIELPTVNARAQGPAAIEQFIIGLLKRVPDFRFKN